MQSSWQGLCSELYSAKHTSSSGSPSRSRYKIDGRIGRICIRNGSKMCAVRQRQRDVRIRNGVRRRRLRKREPLSSRSPIFRESLSHLIQFDLQCREDLLDGIGVIGVGICSGTVAKKPQHPDKFIDARLRYTAETGLFGFLHFAASLLSTHFTVNAHLHAEKNA